MCKASGRVKLLDGTQELASPPTLKALAAAAAETMKDCVAPVIAVTLGT